MTFDELIKHFGGLYNAHKAIVECYLGLAVAKLPDNAEWEDILVMYFTWDMLHAYLAIGRVYDTRIR